MKRKCKPQQVIGDKATQGTEAWHEWRKTRRTASNASVVLGISPFEKPEKMKLREAGLLPPKFYSKAMQEGNEREEEVRRKAEDYFDEIFIPQVWECGKYGASLDGINPDGDTVVELKVSETTYNDIKRGITPEHYEVQVKQQLFCSGAEVGYLVAMNKDGEIAVSEPIYLDDGFIDRLDEAWEAYEAMPIEEIEEVDLTDDYDRALIEQEFVNKKKKYDELGAEIKELDAQLKEGVEVKTHGVLTDVIVSVRKGRVNYEKMFKDLVNRIKDAGVKIDIPDENEYKAPDSIVKSVRIKKGA